MGYLFVCVTLPLNWSKLQHTQQLSILLFLWLYGIESKAVRIYRQTWELMIPSRKYLEFVIFSSDIFWNIFFLMYANMYFLNRTFKNKIIDLCIILNGISRYVMLTCRVGTISRFITYTMFCHLVFYSLWLLSLWNKSTFRVRALEN